MSKKTKSLVISASQAQVINALLLLVIAQKFTVKEINNQAGIAKFINTDILGLYKTELSVKFNNVVENQVNLELTIESNNWMVGIGKLMVNIENGLSLITA